jgi:hypothetical protein
MQIVDNMTSRHMSRVTLHMKGRYTDPASLFMVQSTAIHKANLTLEPRCFKVCPAWLWTYQHGY